MAAGGCRAGLRVRGVGGLPAVVAGVSGNSTASSGSAGFAVRWLPHDVGSCCFTLGVARCALTRCELLRAAASRGTAGVQVCSNGGGLGVTPVANFPRPPRQPPAEMTAVTSPERTRLSPPGMVRVTSTERAAPTPPAMTPATSAERLRLLPPTMSNVTSPERLRLLPPTMSNVTSTERARSSAAATTVRQRAKLKSTSDGCTV